MNNLTKAYIALIFICIVWGTTYLAIEVGAVNYPPFLFAGVRQVVSGIIIVSIALALDKNVDLSRTALLHQALVGFLMITLGNGLVTWSEQYVSSGIAALMCGLMPLSAVVINLILSKGKDKINLAIAIGLLMGVVGVCLIFEDHLRDLANRKYLFGIICLLVATTSWALGSILNKRRPTKKNPVFNAGLQLCFGGLFLLISSPAVDNYSHFVLWNAAGFWSLLYLITLGSVLAYTAYMYSLRMLPVGLVMTYAYVNPLVAVVLGYFVMGEPLSVWTGFAFLAIIGGVFVVNQGYKKQKMEVPKEEMPMLSNGIEE